MRSGVKIEQIQSFQAKKRKRAEIEETDDENAKKSPSSPRPKKKAACNEEVEPKNSSGRNITPPNNLEAIVRKRTLEFVSMECDPWVSLLQCPLASPTYNKPLPYERALLPAGMRHFVLWSLYPMTRSVDQFIASLDPAVTSFFDSLQRSLDKGTYSFKSLKQAMQPAKLKTVANKLPPDFEAIIYKLWDNLFVLSQKQQNGSEWNELDYEKNLYSVIDSLFLRKFRTSSNRDNNLRADFQLSQVFDEDECILLLGENEEKDSTAIGHKDSYKLFELSRWILHGFAKRGFHQISTFGILNGGRKFTLFEFTRENDEKKYNVCWIRDENDITFTYCFEEFAKILKVLVVLWNSLLATETRIQYLIDNPAARSQGGTTSTFIAPEKLDTKVAKLSSKVEETKSKAQRRRFKLEEDDGEKEIHKRQFEDNDDFEDEDEGEEEEEYEEEDTSESMDNRVCEHRKAQDNNFQFSELFPAGSKLLGYVVSRERLRNINFMGFQLAKWCYANNRSVPYEVEIISKFPLETIPQPIKWASVDDNKYHVIIFNGHYHCPTTALRRFRQHAFDFIRTLQYIHETGYVHGDVKLDNTSCDMDRDSFHLFDFDHSCKICEVSYHKFGTPGHRAPEYLLTGEYTVAAEMFSFGVWLIEWFFQQNVPTILAKFRPTFSLEANEPNAVRVLLEIFEEYADSKPYAELWSSHCKAVDRGQESSWKTLHVDETQFQHLRAMIRDLLNEDPAKRPTCHELLTNPKYSPFLDMYDNKSLVIPKSNRIKVTKHKIYSPGYA